MFGIKEEPNVKNLVIWPAGSLEDRQNEARRRLRRTQRIHDQQKSLFWYEMQSLYTMAGEYIEYYLFFFGGSVAWIFFVRFALKILKFPFHRHFLEVCIIYTVPILILLATLILIDKRFTRLEDEEKED
mmetsp:Transcript_15722/g.15859  ORF Transcript_15722/g.15859 Transcript_15722/m.15859 type:complete len:129 (-) Transcript_15722:121-507(-)